ncbi:tyrosine-protein phosphatase non-receptor type 23-like [Haliotis cracherodii]|uniref:tyrosine-protein phosphatase non-receptor type 23-like n=1 Tax=Haliotis cracherodii TaxID=6455 RepID=UPI0039E8B460
MEAVPRLPMLSFELKHSPEYVEFGPSLKQYIREHYGEDPALYNKPCTDLEQLRQGAIHVTRDFMGCSTLKKYYAQLQFLQGRFPMGEGGEAAIAFTWEDIQTGREYILGDIKFEQACILYNIGALHSILGAVDTRHSAEGMKVSCTHFQCAAWAFEHLRDYFGSSAMSTDMSHELLTFHVSLMLAQGQECILEKSMIDSRKNTITAKVSAQVVDFYRTAIKNLETCNQEGIVSSRCYKDWRKRMELKVCFYQCITFYYMGRQSEDQQKMGERLAYFQASHDKLNESMKLAKNEVPEVQDALKFAQDVVGGKFNSAKKDNDFVYHEKVPALDSLPEIKGASLVKGIPFNPTDPEISGPDIFQKLVPMEAHEASSVYSEEKAKLLRKVSGEVEEKSMELEQYMSSLQLDPHKLMPRMEPLPQELLEKCAAMSVKTGAIQSLIESMAAVAGTATEVELNLKEIFGLLDEERKQDEHFQKTFGSRAPNIVLSEIRKDTEMQREKHKQGSQSNENLHKAMNVHIANLRLLAGAPDDLQATLPKQELTNSPEDEALVQELQRLLSKVDEMKKQRQNLMEELRAQVQNDDITNVLVTQDSGSKDSIFEEQLKKHDKLVTLMQQNLGAQDNILRALTDTNARYATIRKATSESIARRDARISELIKSYEVYEDLMGKSQKGLEYYKKLEETVGRILTRCRSVCKVQQEERDQINKRFAAKEAPSRPAAPKPASTQAPGPAPIPAIPGETTLPSFEGPKLRDYLPFMKPATFGPKSTDRGPPDSPGDLVPGGSLPSSLSGSPVHQRGGSPRSSPARQVPTGGGPAGIDYSSLPPEVAAQLSKLPAGFFNKLKDGGGIDASDGLRSQQQPSVPSVPSVPDTGIDPNLPPEIQAQLAKLPKGFFSQMKGSHGSGGVSDNQPSSLPHLPVSGYGAAGNMGQNYHGSLPNMTQLPQHPTTRRFDSTSTVSSVETPVISPTKGPQGDPNVHQHSHHGGQGGEFSVGQAQGQPHHHMIAHYQNRNFQSEYSADQMLPSVGCEPSPMSHHNIGQVGQSRNTAQPVSQSHPGMQHQAQHHGLPQQQSQQPVAPQQQPQQPNILQRPAPASTPQPSQYSATVPQSGPQQTPSQYQYQQLPGTQFQQGYQQFQQPAASQYYQTPGQGTANRSQTGTIPTNQAAPSQTGFGSQQYPVSSQAHYGSQVSSAQTSQTPGGQSFPPNQTYPVNQTQTGSQLRMQAPMTQGPANVGPSQTVLAQQYQMPSVPQQSNVQAGQSNVQSWQGQPGQPPVSQTKTQPNVNYAGQMPNTPQAKWPQSQGQMQQQQQPVAAQQQVYQHYPGQASTPYTQAGYNMQQQQPTIASSQTFVPPQQPGVAATSGYYSQQQQKQPMNSYNPSFQTQQTQQTRMPSQTQVYPQSTNQAPQQYQTQPRGPQPVPIRPQANYPNVQPAQSALGQVQPSQGYRMQPSVNQQPQQQMNQQMRFQQPQTSVGQYQYNQQGQTLPNTYSSQQGVPGQQAPQMSQGPYPQQQPVRPSGGYTQPATQPPMTYPVGQGAPGPQGFNQQIIPQTGQTNQMSRAQPQPPMQYQPVLQPTQAAALPNQVAGSSQPAPQSPVTSHPVPLHPTQSSQGAPAQTPSLHPGQQQNQGLVNPPNLSRQSSSLDEILSSSPESAKDSSIPAPVIAPKVLTAQEIQQQKEEARKNKDIFEPPKEPYSSGCELNKFVSDVEAFGKLVDELTMANVMGQTKLDSIWKELSDHQEQEGKKHSIAIARCYPMKNRDPDIMPYDDTRVMLSTLKDDYINASWLNDLTPSCPKFIATQAPIPVTVNDFWVMVYEQGIEVVVMITSEYETGKKFPCYWPTEKGKQVEHGHVILNMQSVKYREFWTERIIHIKHSETKQGRTVVHLQYKNWPVSGFPDDVSHIVKFIEEVHSFYRQQRSLMKPVMVHCGNGIGRSGAFLLIYTGMQEILHGNGLLDILVMAGRLLQKRKSMIQNKEQVKFAYDSILFFAEEFLRKKDILVKTPHFSGRKKSTDSHVYHPDKDDIVLGSVNLEIIKKNVGKLGEKHSSDVHVASSNGDVQQGQTIFEASISREDNSIGCLPDLIQQPSRNENVGISGQGQGQSMPQTDISSGSGSPQVRSRSGSNTSIKSGSSVSTTSLKGSPQHKAEGKPVPNSLVDLQNPSTFTLGTATPEKKKITKASFAGKPAGIKENLNRPDDPLSSLDPLWTIAKEK